MIPRVASNRVASFNDGARDVGSLQHKSSNHKKSRLHGVAIQHVQKMLRVRIVRAVVIGQGQRLEPGSTPMKVRP